MNTLVLEQTWTKNTDQNYVRTSQCCCHTLNLIVKNLLKKLPVSVKDVVAKAKRLLTTAW